RSSARYFTRYHARVGPSEPDFLRSSLMRLRGQTAVFLCLLGTAGGSFAAGGQTRQLQEEAVRLYRDGRLDEALPLYNRLARKKPNDIVILKNLMWISWKTHALSGTVAAASRVAALLPDDIEAWNLLGQAADASGQWEKAIRAYRKELALEPDRDDVR